MKLKLCVHRKAGAPGYGSDGAGAEIEVEVSDDLAEKPDSLFSCMMHWYSVAERGVAAQIDRMQASHPQPSPAVAEDRPELTDREHPDYCQPAPRNGNGRRWDPDKLPPSQSQTRNGHAYSDSDREDRFPVRQEGRSDHQEPRSDHQEARSDRSDRRNGPPTGAPADGRQLIGWSNSHGCYRELMELARSWRMPGKILDLHRDDVDALYRELSVKSPRRN